MGQAIYSESAYQAAIHRNIVNNARKTFLRTYARAGEVIDFIVSNTWQGGFMKSMEEALGTYGKLTEKQYEAVCRIIDTAAERKAVRDAAIAEQRAKSAFVGGVGEKLEFKNVVVEQVLQIPCKQFYYNDVPYQNLYLMRDQDGNRLVYKTKNTVGIGKGDTVDVKASVKLHTEFRGEKQTVLLRPKFTVQKIECGSHPVG